MLKSTVLAAVNKQIQHEQGNAHAYEAVALYFGEHGLPGLERFMAGQVAEERAHATKLIRHVADRGGHVALGDIPAPQTGFGSPLEAARFVRDLERTTTETTHRLLGLARNEGDYALEVLLHWYVTEQVEEEQWAGELLAQMEQSREHRGQVYMIDHQWGKRRQERAP